MEKLEWRNWNGETGKEKLKRNGEKLEKLGHPQKGRNWEGETGREKLGGRNWRRNWDTHRFSHMRNWDTHRFFSTPQCEKLEKLGEKLGHPREKLGHPQIFFWEKLGWEKLGHPQIFPQILARETGSARNWDTHRFFSTPQNWRAMRQVSTQVCNFAIPSKRPANQDDLCVWNRTSHPVWQ